MQGLGHYGLFWGASGLIPNPCALIPVLLGTNFGTFAYDNTWQRRQFRGCLDAEPDCFGAAFLYGVSRRRHPRDGPHHRG